MFFRKKSAIERDLQSIRRSAMRTMFLVVLLISGFAPAACMWWDYRSNIPLQQQLSSFWFVAVRTYPLTLSIAIIAMSRQLGWFRWGRIFFMGAVITAGAGLGDLMANLTGNPDQAVQAASFVASPENVVFGPLVDSFNYLAGYYDLYGARYFFAAILVGSLAGRTASKLIRHLPRRSQVEELAGEVPSTDSEHEWIGKDQSRRAA